MTFIGDDVESIAIWAGKRLIECSAIAYSIEGVKKLIGSAGTTSSDSNIEVWLTSLAILALKSATIPDRSTRRAPR